MMTMREKLIGAAESVAVVGGEDRDGFQRVKNWPAVIDAILTTLREPDGPPLGAAWAALPDGHGLSTQALSDAFTAMIDRVLRGGK